MQPAVGEGARGCGRIVEVAAHDCAAADSDFADGIGWAGSAVVPDDLDLGARRVADEAGRQFALVVPRARQLVRGLSHAVGADYWCCEFGSQCLRRLWSERRTAATNETQLRAS